MAVILCGAAAGSERPLGSARRLTELRVPVAGATVIIKKPLWSSHVDASSFEDLLAVGEGVAAFAVGGRICGFKESTGGVAWCAGKGTSPAFALGEVAYRDAGGTVRAVDARTGAERWYDARRNVIALWSAGAGFIVVDRVDASGESRYRELDGAGKTLWEAHLAGSIQRPYFDYPYVIQSATTSGGTIVIEEYLLRLGSGGGIKADLGGAAAIAGVEPRLIFLSRGAQGREIEDRFLSFDLVGVDYAGKMRSHLHFAPEYATNASYLSEHPASIAGQFESAASVREERGWIYGQVLANVYRYRLDDGERQRADLVSSGATWLGGPYRGALFFSRSDGVWMLRPTRNAIAAQLVAASTSAVSAFAVARDRAYVGFADGRIRGFNVTNGATTLASSTCVPTLIGASASRVFVVCGGGSTWTIDVFATGPSV